MKVTARHVVLYLLAVLLVGCSSTAAHNQQALEQGQNSFSQGHYTTAFRQLLPAAKASDADAQYAVGYMYYYGEGVTQNRTQAMNWFRKSAQQNNAKAIKALDMISQGVQSSSKKVATAAPDTAVKAAARASEVRK